MARSSVSDEEIQLRKRARRRLVGAIVLVLLAVAAVPMLLDPQPPGRLPPPRVSMPEAASDPAPQPALASEQQPAYAPTSPAMVEATAPEAIPAAPAAEAALSPDEAPASPPPAAASAPAAAEAVGVPARGAREPASGAGAAAAAGRKQAYAVQLIATTSTDKARALERQLRAKKFPVYTEKTPDGDKTRVRVGPFARQEAAEDARRRLVKLGFDAGRVVPKGE